VGRRGKRERKTETQVKRLSGPQRRSKEKSKSPNFRAYQKKEDERCALGQVDVILWTFVGKRKGG